MLTLMRNGGVPMWFILLFGMLSLSAAVVMAARGNLRLAPFTQWMMAATLLSTVNATFADLGATFSFVSKHASEPTWREALFEGLAESTSPGILGFALLTLSAVAIAVARRRAESVAV